MAKHDKNGPREMMPTTNSSDPAQTSTISDREQELLNQVEMLKRQLAIAQQNAALGELLSTTTHEFNNVLTTVINYAKLGMRHKDDPTRDKAFEKIMKAGERAAKITSSVLGMARNRSNSKEPTQLRQLIEESLVLLEREMNKYRVQVELELEDVPEVLAIGNQIQQVLLNLMINARQAMPQGGRLILRLAEDKSTRTVDLMIRDFGGGIPKDQLPRIFDSYYTTKSGPDSSGKGGTGLGLANCKEIIEQHQGRIRVESTPGKGTAFTIKLPVAAPKTPTTVVPGPKMAETPSIPNVEA